MSVCTIPTVATLINPLTCSVHIYAYIVELSIESRLRNSSEDGQENNVKEDEPNQNYQQFPVSYGL